MSFSETIFLFFLALIIFGPKKLPEIARQVGKWMNEFRRASNEFKAQIEQEIAHLDIENRKQTILPPSPPPYGTASRPLNGASSEASQGVTSPTQSSTPEGSPAEAQAVPVTAEDEPLFAATATTTPSTEPPGVAAEANSAAEAIAAAPSQESHA